MRFYVYVIGDIAIECYVGQSTSPEGRFKTHRKNHPNLEQILRILCIVETRREARKIEQTFTKILRNRNVIVWQGTPHMPVKRHLLQKHTTGGRDKSLLYKRKHPEWYP